MYSSYSAATFALRASKPSLHAHSSYSYSYAYLPSHHCHCDDDAACGHRHEPLPQKPYLSPRFLLDGYLLRHSPHFLLLSARLRPRPPPPPHPHPPRCCPRRASARHCDPGSEGPSHGLVSCRAEPCGCWCSWRCFARSDLGPACRQLEARGCCCSGSSNGRSLGTGCQGRGAPRLMRRAVQREVWEYDGEWPHRRCSTECYDDWEEEDQECVHHPRQRLNCGKWDDDGDYNVDVGDHGCRDCGQRKGLETYYDGEDRYSGRRRERRDVDGYHDSFRDTDRRRQLQRHYHDDEDDLDLRRRRQSRRRRDRRDLDFDDTVDTRTVGSRRYDDNDRRYDHRRERRNLDHNDAVDVRRAGSYAEDVRRINRRTDSRDFEIDDEVDLRREGSRHSHVDKRNVIRSQRREYDGDDNSLLQSCHRRNEEFDYDDQDHTERRYYSEGRSQKSLRASDLHEDDAKRASSSRSTADARQENSSSSRVRWRDNVDRWTSDTRDQRYSFGCSSNQREEHDYDEAQYATVRDARTGTQDVKVITEDDSRLASSSNNKTILKHSSNVDQKETVLNDELRKSSHNIMEISEVRGNRIDQDMRAHGYHQEDRTNVENRSSSLQSSVEIASDSRGQIDQRSVVNQQLASQTESTNNKVKFTAVTTDSDRNASSASHRQRNYDEVNQTDIDERSASLQNITHVTRDKERIVNQQVIHETDIDVQNVTHVDVTKIRASDISMSMNSQKHSQTESDVNVTSSMNLIGSANNNALVRAPESKLEAGMSDWFHSTSSTNISDNMKESNDPVELSMAHTNTASVASTSESHLQRTADDQFQLTSALTTIDSVNKQCDLAKIHATDGSVVTSSQGFDTRNGNRIPGTSAVNLLGEHQGMSSQQSIQVSIMQINDEQRTKSYESSQVSREKLVRLEDTERLMQHNMDLIWQEEGASGISNDKDVTRLQIDSTEDGSSMVNKDIARSAMITGRNEHDLRSEGTAGRSIASGSSARQSVKESMLESAARLEKSSTFHVGQFVDELQKGISNTDMGPTKKNEKSMVEGTTTSSSWSRLKGQADEMWDVQSTTSQETFRTADREEGYSADRATDSASQTPKNESALATKVHKSLWAYVADIIRLGWIQRGDSHDSSVKSVKKSSSSNSQSTQGWISSQEHDIDSIRKKYESTKVKDQQLIKSHGVEPESRAVSLPMEENLHAEKQVLQKPEAGIVPQVNRSEGDLLAVSLKADQNISVEGLKQSTVGESPKGSKIEGSTPSSVDVSIGHSLDPEVATSSRITAKGSVENTGKGNSSSMTISSTEPAYIGTGADWIYDPSGAIIPYHHPQMQAVMPHDSTSAEMLESPALPVGGSMRFEEKNVVQETPEVIKTEGKDAELKRKMFQRNKQVLKETFDEWEEAYQRDAELRKADELFMREALLEAQKAADIWEVPVGAVLVQNGEIIARGCNLVEDLRDSTAHAEIVCIREASNKLKTWRLADTTLYVTLEPCAMCAGAILQARIDTVVWGAPNKLLGADGSWVRLFPGDGQTSTLDSANQSQTTGPIHPFHPKITIRHGVLSSECSEIMQQFFQLRRRKNQKPQSPPRVHQQGHHHPLKFFSKMRFGSTFCL